MAILFPGCATFPQHREKKIPSKFSKNEGPWYKLYHYPYRDVFDATLAVLKNRRDRFIVKESRDNHYIVAGFGPVMLSYVWYEVYHFEETAPDETMLTLDYVVSGPLIGTVKARATELIKDPILVQIEVYLIVQKKMREKYKDFSILDVDLSNRY